MTYKTYDAYEIRVECSKLRNLCERLKIGSMIQAFSYGGTSKKITKEEISANGAECIQTRDNIEASVNLLKQMMANHDPDIPNSILRELENAIIQGLINIDGFDKIRNMMGCAGENNNCYKENPDLESKARVLMDQTVSRQDSLQNLLDEICQYILTNKDIRNNLVYDELINTLIESRDLLMESINEAEKLLGQDPKLHPSKRTIDSADLIIYHYKSMKGLLNNEEK